MTSDRGGATSIGTTIAGYRVVRLLGGGRLGRVFECEAPGDRRVAIKLLRSRAAALGDGGLRDGLLRDGRLAAQVRSPHVVAVVEVAVFNNAPFIVMELIEGEDLATRLKGGPLRSVEALEFARQAALGLQALWAAGIAHGDVRPANLLVTSGGLLKVVDAGLAPPLAGSSLRGAAEYTAPERLIGTPIDVLTDIYALGCTLYEMLAGHPPFEGDTAAVLALQAHATAPPLATSPSVVDLVLRMMAKDRAARQKSWGEVVEGINRALDGLGQAPPQKFALPTIEVPFDSVSDEDPFTGARTLEIPAFDRDDSGAVRDESGERSVPPAQASAPPAAASTAAPARAQRAAPPAPAPPASASGEAPAPRRDPATLPVTPLLPSSFDEMHTVVRPMKKAGPVMPTAEDIGLVLEPIDE